MLTANHWTEHGVPNGGVRERTEGAERGLQPHRKNSNIIINQTLQSSQGLNHQPKSTHGGTHGSSCLCSRGWPCQSSIGGEILGSVRAQCPSVGECQGREAELVGWVGEHPHKSREREDAIKGFVKGKLGKGKTLDM